MARHGVQFTFDLDRLNRSMEQTHMVYLHAQVYARAMKFVGPVRKVLPFMTFFNLLGPLVNPSPMCSRRWASITPSSTAPTGMTRFH